MAQQSRPAPQKMAAAGARIEVDWVFGSCLRRAARSPLQGVASIDAARAAVRTARRGRGTASASDPSPSHAQTDQSAKRQEAQSRRSGESTVTPTRRPRRRWARQFRQWRDLGNRDPSVHPDRRGVRIRIALKNEPGIVVAGIGEDASCVERPSALFRGGSLLARHADRDAEIRRLLARRGFRSLESFRNLCGGFLASHTLKKADIIFRPRSPSRRFLGPCNSFSHVLSCLLCVWYKPRFA